MLETGLKYSFPTHMLYTLGGGGLGRDDSHKTTNYKEEWPTIMIQNYRLLWKHNKGGSIPKYTGTRQAFPKKLLLRWNPKMRRTKQVRQYKFESKGTAHTKAWKYTYKLPYTWDLGMFKFTWSNANLFFSNCRPSTITKFSKS